MGAGPGEAYIALGLPAHLGEREMLELMDGAEALAARARRHDLRRRPDRAPTSCSSSVTAVGHAGRTRTARHGAAARGPGDLRRRHGRAGRVRRRPAAAGAKAGGARPRGRRARCWTAICARVRCWRPGGRWRAAGVHAMLDVSDGIASDLERLAEQSGVRIEVEARRAAGRRRRRRGRRGGGRRPARARRGCGRGLRAAVHRSRRRARGSRAGGRGQRVAGDLDRPGIRRLSGRQEAVRLLDETGRACRLRRLGPPAKGSGAKGPLLGQLHDDRCRDALRVDRIGVVGDLPLQLPVLCLSSVVLPLVLPSVVPGVSHPCAHVLPIDPVSPGRHTIGVQRLAHASPAQRRLRSAQRSGARIRHRTTDCHARRRLGATRADRHQHSGHERPRQQ